MNDLIENGIDYAKEHLGTLCSAGAIIGLGITAYLSGKAAVKALDIPKDLEKKEKIKAYAKCYAKTIVAGAVTTGLIIASDRIHVSNEIALGCVANMWRERYVTNNNHESSINKYKDSVALTYLHPDEREKFVVYEPYSDQEITVTRSQLMYAELKINEELSKRLEAPLVDFIKILDGDPKKLKMNLGWSYDNEIQDYSWGYYGGPWIEVVPQMVTRPGGDQVIGLFYMVEPENLDENRMPS
jgi:hypothetical protein